MERWRRAEAGLVALHSAYFLHSAREWFRPERYLVVRGLSTVSYPTSGF